MLRGIFGAKQRSWVVNKNASNQRSDEVLAGQSFPVYSKHEKRIEDAVKLPIGEDLNEWVAANIISFFHDLNLIIGLLAEKCTNEGCPVLNAGPKFEYFWAEDDIVKTPIRVTAPDYMELFLIWAEGIINDENIFPVQIGSPFPKNFIQVCKAISKQMFRVFAHIYHEHYKFMVDIKIEGQLNASFKYYILFCIEFDLLTDKERTPLQEVIKILLGGYNSLQEKTTSQTSEQAM